MKSVTTCYEYSLVPKNQLPHYAAALGPEIGRLHHLRHQGYADHASFINLPFDDALRTQIHTLAAHCKALNPTALVVIGIGGSNMGTRAVHEALLGTYYNHHNPAIAIYWADTVDSDTLWDLILLVEQQFELGHDIILNVVSKSGTTLETIANFYLFTELLKKYKGHTYHNYVVVTTDRDSPLWQVAQQQQFACLEIPHHIGGRYSVLSAVGLFPFALLGIDIDALHEGARAITPSLLATHQNDAALTATFLAYHYIQGLAMHNTFLFSVDMASMGAWYRQLLGESIGKRTATGKRIGITPIVSIGSIDLHSVAQLYLAGPINTVTSFVTVTKNKSNIAVDNAPFDNTLPTYLRGKTFTQLMDAIAQGTQQAYAQAQLPFITIELPEKNAYYMGQLLQLQMLQIVYLGYLLHVNPFDQPHVELYKKETRKILTHE
jgi:glucose-6-phosphate isomerase